MLLDSALKASARKYLEQFAPAMRQKGETLFRKGAVQRIEKSEAPRIFTASVQGGQLYDVLLDGEDETWFGECACPVGADCKHCYAAMRELLESRSKVSAKSDSFIEIVEQKLGRKLKAPEKHFANAVQNIFRQHRHSRMITGWALEPLLGKRSAHWQYAMHELWPETPRDEWQAWLFIAHFLDGQLISWPPFLAEITPAEEVEAALAHWQRQQQIEFWEKRLAAVTASTAEASEGAAELRVIVAPDGIRLAARAKPEKPFEPIKKTRFFQMERERLAGILQLDEPGRIVWEAFHQAAPTDAVVKYRANNQSLNALLRNPLIADCIVTGQGEPFRRSEEPLRWTIAEPESAAGPAGDYALRLVLADGSTPPAAMLVVDGDPTLYFTPDTLYHSPPLGGLDYLDEYAIPAPVLETSRGVTLLDRLRAPLPPRLEARTRSVKARVVFRCALARNPHQQNERLDLTVRAEMGGAEPDLSFTREGWVGAGSFTSPGETIVRIDRRSLAGTAEVIEALKVTWGVYQQVWSRNLTKKFPQEFAEWLESLPPGVELELDPLLATLREQPVAASVKLEVESSEVDWFDLRVALDVSDTTLTDAEIKALLEARGGFVRLGAKGWRRLQFDLSEEDETQLAEIGLSPRDLSAEPQRMHALQLAAPGTARLLPEADIARIALRVGEIQARVSPPLPATIHAELRPYQIEGYHFLAYLSANHFGGILADDMGLGKTLQTLTWLAWLREQPGFDGRPSLVVCPKSVVDNWVSEAAQFLPGLRVRPLARGQGDTAIAAGRAEADLVVVNYTQLRLLERALTATPWHVAILDEAQAIKNPTSLTARAALALKAGHRLALSGTPIENRLLDLWSIMRFAMPGALGTRTHFIKRYDQRSDPFARRRLSARVRPFVLRRTKNEVARDLPARTEEDLYCEMEGPQETLYQAELKKARQHLLKLKTSRDLDKARFNILTSLLRLRQICCHPVLVSARAAKAESAKLTGLLDLLEPLMEEGHKVLVFSQFVEMLGLIQQEVVARQWPHFLLTGQTEERGTLVREFQGKDGAAVFLISLRAGGFGLNLTAASYVVLFDPWWNPAVENQAIDRTHRIGQTSQVFAYRLVVKDSIEEKIRSLQRQKSALASDVLGEENFARALTLDDFNFLLGED